MILGTAGIEMPHRIMMYQGT